MPVTKENYKKAQAALDAAKNDPNADPVKVQRLQMNLNSFYESYNGDTTDENGQRTAEPVGQKYPSTTAQAPLNSTPDSSHDFYYEPAPEQVRARVASDPTIGERLHIGSYIGSPDQVASLDPGSDAYKAVADEMWKETAAKAKQSGKNLTRYRDVSFRKNPLDYLSGLAGRVGPTVFSGLNKTFGGLAEPVAKGFDYVLGSTPSAEQNSFDASRNAVSEPASTAVEYGSMFLPIAPGNLAARGVLGIGKYGARSGLGKLALGTVAGIAGSNAQGLTNDIGNAVNNGGDVDSVLKSAYENAPMRTVTGGVLGGLTDLVAQGANAVRGSIRGAPAYRDLNTLEQAGGGTKVLKGVDAPPAVKENISVANAPENRGVKTAADVAAEKVAPPIYESLKAEREAAVQEAEKNLGQYFKENQNVAHPTTEVADEIVGQLSRGHKVSPLGEVGNANPGLANKLRRHLGNFADVTTVSKDQAEGLISKNGGRVLTPKEYESATGKKMEGDGVPVMLPHRLNPEQLHVAEQGIANELRYGANGEPVDDPALKAIQRALFQVRDKFTAPLGGESAPEQPFELSNPNAKRSIGAGDTQAQSIAPEPAKSSTQSLDPGAVEDVTSERATGADTGELSPEATLKNKYEIRESSKPTMEPVKKNGLPFTPSELEKAATVADGKAFYDDLFAQGREARLREQRRIGESVANEDKFVKGLAKGATEEVPKVSLSKEETDAINNAKSSLGALRNPNPENKAVLDSAISKLSKDNPGIVYRGMRLNPDQLDNIVKNGYSLDEHTMGSSSKEAAEKFAGGVDSKVPVIFQMEGTPKAAVAHGYEGDSFPQEQNVIIPKGTKYKVSKVEETDIKPEMDWMPKQKGKVVYLQAVNEGKPATPSATTEDKSKGQPKGGQTQGKDNTAVLPNGQVVSGLSALQRKHHEALSALEEATKDTGGSNPKAIHRKVIGFKNGNDMFANQELANQAKKLGLEQQLHEVAATNVFPSLKERQSFEGRNGILNATKDAALLRLIDPLASYVGNSPPNPFVGNPHSPGGRIQQYWLENAARNMLNMQGGLPGARFGNSLAEQIKAEQDKQAQEDAMQNIQRQ